MSEDRQDLAELERVLGYCFRNRDLLRQALTHASLSPAGYRSYERLEFLGDAVAGLVVAQRLFESEERYSEGEMTEIKAATVNRRSMATAGERLGLSSFLRAEQGLADRQRYPRSLISDAYEALVGALYLDGGLEEARRFVLSSLGPELQAAEQSEHPPNYKSILQEKLQSEGHAPPVYRTAARVGPEHNTRFQAAAYVDGKERGRGWGPTKKQAEQKAAQEALKTLYPQDDDGRQK